jgi:dTDP-4-dehydrorhamnose reductase
MAKKKVEPVEPKIVILGGKGMLGTNLANLCRQRKINAKVLDLPECDITDKNQLKKAIAGCDAVINCAAYTNVDKAESKPQAAFRINAEAVGRLGQIAHEQKIFVIHISTDFVFDGKSDKPYRETDKPNPINTYGKSKLAGEQLLVASGCANCIIRFEWTYGLAGDNFVKKIIRAANAALRNSPPQAESTRQTGQLKVVDDQIGSPTATTEAAKVILKLLAKKTEGLFHFASAGFVSRFEMAKFIFEKLNMPVTVLPCKTGDFKSAAERPLNSRFDCSKIAALLDEPIEVWQKPLENFLTELQKRGLV